MKTLFLALLLTPLLASIAQPVQPSVEQIDATLLKKTHALNAEYLLFQVGAAGKKAQPLLIYLHGGGGKGEDIRRIEGQVRQLTDGIQRFQKGPCLIVAPQCLRQSKAGGHATWTHEDLNILLAHLKATLPIDAARIYLTGNSMGGFGSWMWGGNNPEHFAAIAPIVGGIGYGGPKDITKDLDAWAANLAKVPVFAFVGALDKVVPADRSEQMVVAIRKAGGEQVRFRNYPDEGHNARRVTYGSAEFYDWVFAKKRD
jgi:predicted peptidase